MKTKMELTEDEVKVAISQFCEKKIGGSFSFEKVRLSATAIEDFAGRRFGAMAITASAEQD